MSNSPKKHRGTFRPVNTLSSPQKPQYHTTYSSSKAPPVPTFSQPRSSQALLHIPLIDDGSDESHSDSGHPRSVADRSETEYLGNSSSLFDDVRKPPSVSRFKSATTLKNYVNGTTNHTLERF